MLQATSILTLLLISCNMCMCNNTCAIECLNVLNVFYCTQSVSALVLKAYISRQTSHNQSVHSWITLSQNVPSYLAHTQLTKLIFLSLNFQFCFVLTFRSSSTHILSMHLVSLIIPLPTFSTDYLEH